MRNEELIKQVELKGVDYSSFKVPPCRQCEEERREKLGIVKPNVVFFVCTSLTFLILYSLLSPLLLPLLKFCTVRQELTNREKL